MAVDNTSLLLSLVSLPAAAGTECHQSGQWLLVGMTLPSPLDATDLLLKMPLGNKQIAFRLILNIYKP